MNLKMQKLKFQFLMDSTIQQSHEKSAQFHIHPITANVKERCLISLLPTFLLEKSKAQFTTNIFNVDSFEIFVNRCAVEICPAGNISFFTVLLSEKIREDLVVPFVHQKSLHQLPCGYMLSSDVQVFTFLVFMHHQAMDG